MAQQEGNYLPISPSIMLNNQNISSNENMLWQLTKPSQQKAKISKSLQCSKIEQMVPLRIGPLQQCSQINPSVRIAMHPGLQEFDDQEEFEVQENILDGQRFENQQIGSQNNLLKEVESNNSPNNEYLLQNISKRYTVPYNSKQSKRQYFKSLQSEREAALIDMHQQYVESTQNYSKINFENLQKVRKHHQQKKDSYTDYNNPTSEKETDKTDADVQKELRKRAGISSDINTSFGVMIKLFKFIRKIKLFYQQNNAKNLQHQQLKLVNDISFTSLQNTVKTKSSCIERLLLRFQAESNQYKNFLTFLCSKCCGALDHIPIIQPTNPLNIIREFVHIFFIIFTMFYVPIELIEQIVFSNIYGDNWTAWVIITYVFFITDILVKFNTGIYEKGLILTSRKKIAARYMSDQFIRDIIALFPLIFNSSGYGAWRVFNLCIFIKITTVSSILENIQDMIASYKPKSPWPHYIQLIKLGMTVIFCAHIVACLFLFIAIAESNYYGMTNTWLIAYGADQSPWYEQYLSSLYFSVTTMTTVGYGDITPKTIYEIAFAILNLIASCGIFAYTFNSVGGIIFLIQKDAKDLEKLMSLVNRYLEIKQITTEMKVQVRQYVQFKFDVSQELKAEEELEVLKYLPDHVQQKLLFEVNSRLLQQCKTLLSQFSQPFLDQLAMKIHEVRLQKHEVIFEEGDAEEDPALFIIERGEIDIYYETLNVKKQQHTVKTLKDASYFGEFSFLTCQARTAGAKAREFSIIYRLLNSDFINTLKEFPLDYERYLLLRDRLLFTDSKYAIHIQCYACREIGHQTRDCHLLHYVPDKEHVILKNCLYSISHIRGNIWPRKAIPTSNALLSQKICSEKNEEFVQKWADQPPVLFYERLQEEQEQQEQQQQLLELLHRQEEFEAQEQKKLLQRRRKIAPKAAENSDSVQQIATPPLPPPPLPPPSPVAAVATPQHAPQSAVAAPPQSQEPSLLPPVQQAPPPLAPPLLSPHRASQQWKILVGQPRAEASNALTPQQLVEAQKVQRNRQDQIWYLEARERLQYLLPPQERIQLLQYRRLVQTQKLAYSNAPQINVHKCISRLRFKQDYQDFVKEIGVSQFEPIHEEQSTNNADFQNSSLVYSVAQNNIQEGDEKRQRKDMLDHQHNAQHFKIYSIFWPNYNISNVLNDLKFQRNLKQYLAKNTILEEVSGQDNHLRSVMADQFAKISSLKASAQFSENNKRDASVYTVFMQNRKRCNAELHQNERMQQMLAQRPSIINYGVNGRVSNLAHPSKIQHEIDLTFKLQTSLISKSPDKKLTTQTKKKPPESLRNNAPKIAAAK